MLEYDWENSVGHWVCTTSHIMRRSLSNRLSQAGITLRQWEVLAWLSCNGDVCQAQLAECLGIEPHTLAGVLRRMERDGWLKRTCCSEDRRRNKLVPTEKAETVWNGAVAWCRQVRAQATQGFTEDEIATLRDLCSRIRENLGNETECNGAAPTNGRALETAGATKA
ncbi:MAG: MarR family winged helix-turn-helix transcriptional regulator [Maioricimonas sp. JB049]